METKINKKNPVNSKIVCKSVKYLYFFLSCSKYAMKFVYWSLNWQQQPYNTLSRLVSTVFIWKKRQGIKYDSKNLTNLHWKNIQLPIIIFIKVVKYLLF